MRSQAKPGNELNPAPAGNTRRIVVGGGQVGSQRRRREVMLFSGGNMPRYRGVARRIT